MSPLCDGRIGHMIKKLDVSQIVYETKQGNDTAVGINNDDLHLIAYKVPYATNCYYLAIKGTIELKSLISYVTFTFDNGELDIHLNVTNVTDILQKICSDNPNSITLYNTCGVGLLTNNNNSSYRDYFVYSFSKGTNVVNGSISSIKLKMITSKSDNTNIGLKDLLFI